MQNSEKPKIKNVSVISDCVDSNAKGRQMARYGSIMKSITPTFIEVSNDLEAAGNIVDQLDAYSDQAAIIVANVAPRSFQGKEFPNGTPFGFTKFNNSYILASYQGYTLSLAKQVGLIDDFYLLPVEEVVPALLQKEIITNLNHADRIYTTQFRSFDYLPYIVKALLEGEELPSQKVGLEDLPKIDDAVWYIDNFGNVKTTLDAGDFSPHETYQTNFGKLGFYSRLKDVPDGVTALIAGSSGYKDFRFLELVTQGKSVSKQFGIKVGDGIFSKHQAELLKAVY